MKFKITHSDFDTDEMPHFLEMETKNYSKGVLKSIPGPTEYSFGYRFDKKDLDLNPFPFAVFNRRVADDGFKKLLAVISQKNVLYVRAQISGHAGMTNLSAAIDFKLMEIEILDWHEKSRDGHPMEPKNLKQANEYLAPIFNLLANYLILFAEEHPVTNSN